MIIGILKEIKTEENRVSMIPAGVEVMIQNGHTLLVEKEGGKGSGFEDDDYKKAGADIVAKTSTIALTNATLPYAVQIANKGWRRAMRENPEIKLGANVMNGKVTYQAVAEAFGLEYTPIETLL